MERKTVWQLARLAGCADPDSESSPGAQWLARVEDAAEDIENRFEDLHETSDGLVPIYTHERWRVFVDLAAYNEDVTELGADASDLEQCAGTALYIIAERLLGALVEEKREEEEDEDEDEDENDEATN